MCVDFLIQPKLASNSILLPQQCQDYKCALHSELKDWIKQWIQHPFGDCFHGAINERGKQINSLVGGARSSAQSVCSENDLYYKACSGYLGSPRASASKSVASHKRHFLKAKGTRREEIGRMPQPRNQSRGTCVLGNVFSKQHHWEPT